MSVIDPHLTADVIHLLSNSYCGVKSIRKWRMVAIACCRSVWPHLSEWGRESLVLLEQVAEGDLPDSARSARSAGAPPPTSTADRAVYKAIRPGKEARQHARYDIPRHALSAAGPRDGDPGREAVRAHLAHAARDIFGPPYHPPPVVDAAWLTWNDSTALRLAQGIADGQAFDRLPILADALEEAGCTSEEVLEHLRGPGPHVRGCWALDLILGGGERRPPLKAAGYEPEAP